MSKIYVVKLSTMLKDGNFMDWFSDCIICYTKEEAIEKGIEWFEDFSEGKPEYEYQFDVCIVNSDRVKFDETALSYSKYNEIFKESCEKRRTIAEALEIFSEYIVERYTYDGKFIEKAFCFRGLERRFTDALIEGTFDFKAGDIVHVKGCDSTYEVINPPLKFMEYEYPLTAGKGYELEIADRRNNDDPDRFYYFNQILDEELTSVE